MDDKNGLLFSRRGAIESSLALGLLSAMPSAFAAETSSIRAAINAGKTGHPISDYIYGGFLEHGGNLINYSLWSEVLDDRKFFHPVDKTPLPKPERLFPGMTPDYKWMALGPVSSVTMDTEHPYVGDQSPVVHVSGSHPLGMYQDGRPLAKKSYTGRIVVAGDPGVTVSVTLIWGKGPDERESHVVPVAAEWKTVPLHFDCRGATKNGRMEITGRGKGTFKVGAVSLMPADNVKGFRADTIALMKEMDFKMLRLPGGNFISAYDWKNTIGDPDKRPPIYDPVWKAVQPNDAGLDELLEMCRLMNVEPYWCINTGFGEPRSGGEIVEYVNGAATTFWGAKRAANGHPEPWHVKYWDVGNEMYGHWQWGHMAPSQYHDKHKMFAKAMREADPSIYLTVPGGFVDEMTTGQGMMADSGSPLVAFGSDRDWAGGMLKDCYGTFDALNTHAYPAEGMHFNLKTGKNEPVKQTMVEFAQAAANRVATMADCWEEYKKRFPQLNDGKVKVFFDEYAYHFKQDLKGMLALARCFHEFFRHSDFIDMAGYTMATGWMNYDRTHSAFSTVGMLFKFYNQHFGKIPVELSGNSPVPPPKYPVGGDQPKHNTGSSTYPLDMFAALTADRKALVLAVVSVEDKPKTFDLALGGFKAAGTGKCWKLTGPGPDATNPFDGTPQIGITEGTFDTTAKQLTVAPYSIEFYRFEAA